MSSHELRRATIRPLTKPPVASSSLSRARDPSPCVIPRWMIGIKGKYLYHFHLAGRVAFGSGVATVEDLERKIHFPFERDFLLRGCDSSGDSFARRSSSRSRTVRPGGGDTDEQDARDDV